MIVFWFFEDEKDKKDKNTKMDIKVRGTGIYATDKFPPCAKGETFQALEFIRWENGKKVYRRSIELQYTGYRTGPLKEYIVYAKRPGTTFEEGGYFLDVAEEEKIIIEEE